MDDRLQRALKADPTKANQQQLLHVLSNAAVEGWIVMLTWWRRKLFRYPSIKKAALNIGQAMLPCSETERESLLSTIERHRAASLPPDELSALDVLQRAVESGGCEPLIEEVERGKTFGPRPRKPRIGASGRPLSKRSKAIITGTFLFTLFLLHEEIAARELDEKESRSNTAEAIQESAVTRLAALDEPVRLALQHSLWEGAGEDELPLLERLFGGLAPAGSRSDPTPEVQAAADRALVQELIELQMAIDETPDGEFDPTALKIMAFAP